MDTGTERQDLSASASRWVLVQRVAKANKVEINLHVERHAKMLKHQITRSLPTYGMKFYRTQRDRNLYNRFYLLWQGEHPDVVEQSIAEARFLYDHLPKTDFRILGGAMQR